MADPANLSDDALREQIRAVAREEDRISYDRRILHGRIDVVRAEILSRIDRAHDANPPAADEGTLEALTARLAAALTHKGPPPLDAELERFGADDEDESVIADLLEGDELPDLRDLSDADVAAVARALARRERVASGRRHDLHKEIDGLRREHVARLRTRHRASTPATGDEAD